MKTKAKYAWRIIRDYLTPKGEEGYAAGKAGPSNSDGDPKAFEKREKFRLLDDDDQIYYAGEIGGDYDGFEPLDDFGAGWAGCTTVQYKNEAGEWEDL